MYIKTEINFATFDWWSGAKDFIQKINNAGLMDELEQAIENTFVDREEIPEDTEINDLMWFESDYLLEMMGYKECSRCGELIANGEICPNCWEDVVKEICKNNDIELKIEENESGRFYDVIFNGKLIDGFTCTDAQDFFDELETLEAEDFFEDEEEDEEFQENFENAVKWAVLEYERGEF